MSDMLSPTPTDDESFDLEREPLDRPPPAARDWGGDGTDLSRPVRAHALAALRPNTAPYPPPVDALGGCFYQIWWIILFPHWKIPLAYLP